MSHSENSILLKPVLVGVTSVAHFINTGHEHTQLNQVCYFLFFSAFLASNELFFTTAVVLFGGYKKYIHQDNMSVCFIPPYTPLLYSKTGVYRGIHYMYVG